MSYKCGVCKQSTPVGQPRLLHLVKRPDGSILKEIPVCEHCHRMLTGGRSVKSLLPGRKQAAPPQAVPLKRSNN